METPKKLRAVMIGTGNRGTTYASLAHENCPELEIIAVADPNPSRRDYIQQLYSLPDSACFNDYNELLSRPKEADAALVCTQDQLHFDPAMKAIAQGYHLLLEKPVAPTPLECMQLSEAAQEKGVFVCICHVLRYTPFFRLLKHLIDTDRVGRVINIVHVEGVGNTHMSHSYVRGNWRNSETSSPMILAKSCHDMDILLWLLGRHCTRVSSFGSLSYFCADNMPEGAPEYCHQGCPAAESCPYDARKVYLRDRQFIEHAAKRKNPTTEEITKAITETNYGRCVFRSDNNVVDHQVVNLEYDDGATVSFTMSAFNEGGRKLRIMGTKGEITANMSDDHVTLYNFHTRQTEIIRIADAIQDETINGGHGGGDRGLIRAFCQYLTGCYTGNSLTDVATSIESHLISFAAEEARLTGATVSMEDYKNRFRSR